MILGNPVREMFSSSLGIVAGVVFTIGAFLKAALGKFKYAAPPVEDYEGSTRAIFNVLLFAPLILALVGTTPTNASILLCISVGAGIISFICRQQFVKAKAGHLFKVPVPRKCQRLRKFLGMSVYKEEFLVGGEKLIPAAARDKASRGITDEELLSNAGYKPAELWEDSDRAAVQIRIERWYFGYIFLAVMTLVVASFSFQAILSGESPRDAATRIWVKTHPPPHP
jgi:hypothetical protein